MNTIYLLHIFSASRQIIIVHCRNNVLLLVHVKQTLNVIFTVVKITHNSAILRHSNYTEELLINPRLKVRNNHQLLLIQIKLVYAKRNDLIIRGGKGDA